MRCTYSLLLLLGLAVPTLAQQADSQPSASGGATLLPPIYSSGGSPTSKLSLDRRGGGRAGTAEMIRAAGEYNYNSLAGLPAAAQTQSQVIASRNSTAALNNYFTLKQINENYRKTHNPLLSPTQAQAVLAAAAMMGSQAPDELPVRSTHGEIHWPAVLNAPGFRDYRRSNLDDLFAQRAELNSGLGTPVYGEIVQTVRAFEKRLQESLDRMTPTEYVAAKRS